MVFILIVSPVAVKIVILFRRCKLTIQNTKVKFFNEKL